MIYDDYIYFNESKRKPSKAQLRRQEHQLNTQLASQQREFQPVRDNILPVAPISINRNGDNEFRSNDSTFTIGGKYSTATKKNGGKFSTHSVNLNNVSSEPYLTPQETKKAVAVSANAANTQGGSTENRQETAQDIANELGKVQAEQKVKKDAQSTSKPETSKIPAASTPTPTKSEVKKTVTAAANAAKTQGGTTSQQQDNAEIMANAQAQQDAKKDAQSTPKSESPKAPVTPPPAPTPKETKNAVETATAAAKTQGGTPEQQQQTAQAVAKAKGKQKAKMSTKKKIGIGAGAAAGVAGLAIGGKIAYDYAKYKKWKAKNPLRKNVTFKQWKAKQKKKLHESFNEGYQAALEEFYY